jgi:type VI protein secretion system component VasF
MLAYLDSLCAALLARDTSEIRRLLAHPLAQDLPRRVREEAVAISRAGRRSFIAPVNALHLYYKLTHVVDETSDPTLDNPPVKDEPGKRDDQLDLPLRKVSSR